MSLKSPEPILYQISENQYVAALQIHSLGTQRLRWIFIVCFGCLILLVTFWDLTLVSMLSNLILLAVVYAMLRLGLPLQARKKYRRNNTIGLLRSAVGMEAGMYFTKADKKNDILDRH